MSLKKIKPNTPGQRFRIANNFNKLTSFSPEKKLTIGKKSSGGRNNKGKITIKYLGGGHKKKYRFIDFKREKLGIRAIVKSIEYDPNRSSFISLLHYLDGEKRYILSQKDIKIGDKIISGKNIEYKIGNSSPLSELPIGSIISCIEMKPGQGAKIARSAGTYAKLLSRDGKYSIIKLPSGSNRMILSSCMATIGIVSNCDNKLIKYGKAGRKRWLGRRPRTRAVAMNPVDHPMGGGEGKASGGHPRNKNNIPSKGYKTRKKNKLSNKYIINKN